MKKYLAILFFISIGCTAEEIKNVKVIRVLDGDTIDVKTIPDKIPVYEVPIRVRLMNIDAPEKKQSYGLYSQKLLSDKISQAKVDINIQSKDRYGRYLGEVYYKGENINRYMVINGGAWVYQRFNTDDVMPGLEKQAKLKKMGLWMDNNPTPPWIFRHLEDR